jgi:hypothetical protein
MRNGILRLGWRKGRTGLDFMSVWLRSARCVSLTVDADNYITGANLDPTNESETISWDACVRGKGPH